MLILPIFGIHWNAPSDNYEETILPIKGHPEIPAVRQYSLKGGDSDDTTITHFPEELQRMIENGEYFEYDKEEEREPTWLERLRR